MSTIWEIAKATGLSIATVSKALNGKKGVRPETVAVVLAKAEELNYRPNLNARYLKTGNNRTIGIIAEDFTVFSTPLIIDGVAVCCENRGYHYLLGNLRFVKRFGSMQDSRNDVEKKEIIQDMVDNMLMQRVDGVLYVNCHSRSSICPVDTKGMKCVYVYSCAQNLTFPTVAYDEFGGAYQATELLIQKGHTRIGIIAGQCGSLHTINRERGCQQAMFEHGIPYSPMLEAYCDWDYEKAYRSVPDIIEKGATAIFAFNDVMALAVIDYCNAHDIAVGSDLLVIGLDNNAIAQICRPRLSSVNVPYYDIGYQGAEMLIDMLETDKEPEERHILLPCNVIRRESTGDTCRVVSGQQPIEAF